jgi:hypothetical protein
MGSAVQTFYCCPHVAGLGRVLTRRMYSEYCHLILVVSVVVIWQCVILVVSVVVTWQCVILVVSVVVTWQCVILLKPAAFGSESCDFDSIDYVQITV